MINQITLHFRNFNNICLTFLFFNIVTNDVIKSILFSTFKETTDFVKKYKNKHEKNIYFINV